MYTKFECLVHERASEYISIASVLIYFQVANLWNPFPVPIMKVTWPRNLRKKLLRTLFLRILGRHRILLMTLMWYRSHYERRQDDLLILPIGSKITLDIRTIFHYVLAYWQHFGNLAYRRTSESWSMSSSLASSAVAFWIGWMKLRFPLEWMCVRLWNDWDEWVWEERWRYDFEVLFQIKRAPTADQLLPCAQALPVDDEKLHNI